VHKNLDGLDDFGESLRRVPDAVLCLVIEEAIEVVEAAQDHAGQRAADLASPSASNLIAFNGNVLTISCGVRV